MLFPAESRPETGCGAGVFTAAGSPRPSGALGPRAADASPGISVVPAPRWPRDGESLPTCGRDTKSTEINAAVKTMVSGPALIGSYYGGFGWMQRTRGLPSVGAGSSHAWGEQPGSFPKGRVIRLCNLQVPALRFSSQLHRFSRSSVISGGENRIRVTWKEHCVPSVRLRNPFERTVGPNTAHFPGRALPLGGASRSGTGPRREVSRAPDARAPLGPRREVSRAAPPGRARSPGSTCHLHLPFGT